jgi:hypothetical protein
MVSGKLYFINGWLKKTKDGQPYLSLSFKAKTEPKATGAGSLDNDSIPF